MVTSYETSRNLQRNGFVQPEISDMQIWWIEYSPGEWKRFIIFETGGMQEKLLRRYPERVYAATAWDIMKCLGDFPQLTYNNDKDVFQCQGHEDKEDAEACAKAYLDRKRKEREADGKV